MYILSKGFDEGGLLDGVFKCVPPKPGFAAVATVNAAIIALAKAVADQGIKDGVQVNSVAVDAGQGFGTAALGRYGGRTAGDRLRAGGGCMETMDSSAMAALAVCLAMAAWICAPRITPFTAYEGPERTATTSM